MLISYKWLQDYVGIKMPAERLAELLTMSGLSVASVKSLGGDHIFEIEVTSNRPDWLSVVGVAREVAAITGRKLKVPSSVVRRPLSAKKQSPNPQPQTPVSIKVEDKKLCPAYTARVIRNVKVGESPEWLKAKIEAMGLRPVNNIVDITNFCLFETGEPMHAFDLDTLSGREIIVRKAKKGEKIVTIDGTERPLDGSCLVIADHDNPAAIAGVMGSLQTEVTHKTRNILLEAASFDPISVRRTARKLGVSTESSYRFERRVDPANILYSSDRASLLIKEIAGGEISELFKVGNLIPKKRSVGLRYSKLNDILGVDIPEAKVKKILNSLGINTKATGKLSIKAEIPAFRNDIENEIDLIEEAARVYGYDKVPRSVPRLVEQLIRLPFEVIVERRIREALVRMGLDEIITYSLLAKKNIPAEDTTGKNTVEIINPLSSEQEIMRTSLIPGLLNTIARNINRKTKDLKLFELGNVYLGTEKEDNFSEKRTLSIGITGHEFRGWAAETRAFDFFSLKGIVESLFGALGIDSYSIKYGKDGRLSPQASAVIELDNQPIGYLGEVSGDLLDEFEIKDKVYASEISIEPIFRKVILARRFRELAKYPSVFRDISIVVDSDIANAEILESIRSNGKPLLKNAGLIDRYTGKPVQEGKISLTYRLEYQDLARTLEEKDVSPVHSTILTALESKFGAKLR